MLEGLKRYAGLTDDCPAGQDDSGRAASPGDSLLGTGGGPEPGYGAAGYEDTEDAPPRYCHRPPSPPVKRAMKITVGSVLLCVGVVMFVTPGPALIVIPVALGILASEIPWLRRHLHALRVRIHEYRMRRKRAHRAAREAKKIKENQ